MGDDCRRLARWSLPAAHEIAWRPAIAAMCLAASLAPGPAFGGDGTDVLDREFVNRPGIAGILQARLAELIAATTGDEVSGHEASDGPHLIVDLAQAHVRPVFSPQRCPDAAETKVYEIAAVATRITLNRYGDHDPEGRIYTRLANTDKVQAAGRAGGGENFGLSLGLGDDVIQPLTLRANVGDCLRISMTNLMREATSFHVHGADLVLAETGEPALSSNPDATALPNDTLVYEWYIDPDYYRENTHYAHPHGPSARFQVTHGLFAAIIVEGPGSEYFNPRSGDALCGPAASDGSRDCVNSWDAVISPGLGEDFREFAIFYHEVGNEDFNVRSRNGAEMDAIEPVTITYKPSGRAINYRSESFHNRLIDMDAAHPDFYGAWNPDASLAYSSYTFGDPVTPIPQSYLGDPVKFRLIHGGSETYHVPHLHGGGVQWARQPEMGRGQADYVPMSGGLQKQFAASMPSTGTDSQSLGPSETYDLEIGCGSGGCQQSVGDFMFHCHIASHYIAGMWHFWRVYNTKQDGAGKTDTLPAIIELPDRAGAMQRAVTSEELIGKTVEFAGRTIAVDETKLSELVEVQLPPQGRRRHVQDAQVFDWERQGNLYLNEPETELRWPGYRSATPGERPPFMFDAGTAKLAWPFLNPHLGLRPPFAPHHGPAPFLEPLGHESGEPPVPGANGPASLCPDGAPRRIFKIHAIQLPIRVSARRTLRQGMLYVLKEQE
ncbi:MAG: multicopper oxidase domain-containing protein, partial [Alphaproteobacteria bacterium]|nr:multicopper oxidase domain-containing protein [Alphaproteobacteria bacterium]